MAKFNPYQVITDTLIASIEAGTPAWRCGWTNYRTPNRLRMPAT